jgi:hypothetical protein
MYRGAQGIGALVLRGSLTYSFAGRWFVFGHNWRDEVLFFLRLTVAGSSFVLA